MAATQYARPCTLLVRCLAAVDSSHLSWQFMICPGRVTEDCLNKCHDWKYLGNEGKWQPNQPEHLLLAVLIPETCSSAACADWWLLCRPPCCTILCRMDVSRIARRISQGARSLTAPSLSAVSKSQSPTAVAPFEHQIRRDLRRSVFHFGTSPGFAPTLRRGRSRVPPSDCGEARRQRVRTLGTQVLHYSHRHFWN